MSDSVTLLPLTWETRNLGIPAFELSKILPVKLCGTVLSARLGEMAKEHDIFFVQARVKIDTEVTRVLEKSGFYFVEATICPHTVLDRNDALKNFLSNPGSFLPARYALSDIKTTNLDKADAVICSAVREIARESFTEDRFHLDNNCERSVADRRFVYWVDDLLQDSATTFDLMFLRGHPIAFMARRASRLILAGFSRRYAGAGLGDFLWLHALQQVKADGSNQVHTLISVRNIPVLNLYARLGFKFRDPFATFHYWKSLDSTL